MAPRQIVRLAVKNHADEPTFCWQRRLPSLGMQQDGNGVKHVGFYKIPPEALIR